MAMNCRWLRGWMAAMAVAALGAAGLAGCGDDGSGDDDMLDAGPMVPACENRMQDDDEPDVDCGGPCPPCRVGRMCFGDEDCQSENCGDDNVCGGFPTCDDGEQNGAETGVDCGGPACEGCADGDGCEVDTDCVSNRCAAGVCASCEDGVQNGSETGTDCGGPECGPCIDGEGCTEDDDCITDNCSDNVCVSCFDGVQNADETDIDCGGPECRKCPDSAMCTSNDDCRSNRCADNVCVSCMDGVLNGTETDIDCGGDLCGPCPDLAMCAVNEDCVNGVCDPTLMQCVSCMDEQQNQDETDVDCGGATCGPCEDLLACNEDTDCVNERCVESVCVSCMDETENGDETDVDCGGTVCGPCGDGLGCLVDADCACGGVCDDAMLCDAGGRSEVDSDDDYRLCELTATTAPCPDISETGTEITIGDDDFVDVTLPFSFDFYGIARDTVRIESNGGLTFGDAANEIDVENECIPGNTDRGIAPANQAFIAVFWDDLDPTRVITGELNSVYHETQGTAPNRTFIVQWQVAPWEPGDTTESGVDLRAVLHETSNLIEVCYVDTDTEDTSTCGASSACHEDGINASSGIQEDDSNGLEYSCDTADLTNDLVLEYTPL